MGKIKTLSIDIESYSNVDLQKCGVYRYAKSSNFEILLFGYVVDHDIVNNTMECYHKSAVPQHKKMT